ncbi:ATP-binding protein [Neorhizobium sp. JUb45]|uniref:sensor histidine kinase n=1 Tax=unclassified Neorhizobium TaxID=2629175 RepID=UPI0010E5749B|nr:ATP-binding protein [Neorhizobium sp. JUb45]TCR06091.1 signal transduction histidine kinase [Neorhizobium sp. JUb45]
MSFARLIDWVWNSTFRYTVVLFVAIAVAVMASLIFAYVNTSRELVSFLDGLIIQESDSMVAQAKEGHLTQYEERLRQDPRRYKPTGLFAPTGERISGNILRWPAGLEVDQAPIQAEIHRFGPGWKMIQPSRALARRLSDGTILVVGWSTKDNEQTALVVERGLIFGLLPAFLLGLAASLLFAARTQRRIREMQLRAAEIVAGDFARRLPTRNSEDPLDKLAQIVNGMLDEIQTLVENLAAIGDDIAHDLRTPLARVRIGLERAKHSATTPEEFQAATDRAMAGVDHAISIVTALLRIREIEQTRRFQAFGSVDLAELITEVGELYEPFAEEKKLALTVHTDIQASVQGDRDLLFEAIANLVDNAVKYTPEGGRIDVALASEGGHTVIRVRDTGPGIAENERELLAQRFYRSDRSRHTKGLGLGLTLVAAIVKLHGFRFEIKSGGGFVAGIVVPQDGG